MADYDAQADRPTPAEPELSRAQLEADDVDLHVGLSGVAGIVAGGRGVVDVLHDIAQFAAQAIPGVDGAGVTMAGSSAGALQIQAWAVTADFVHEIDTVQYHELHEGPCITCMQSRRPIVSGSLGDTPYTTDWTNRPAQSIAPRPSTMPMATSRIDSLITMPTTVLRWAPSAMRTPISLVRRATL